MFAQLVQPQPTRQHALPWQHVLLLMAFQTAGEPIACGRRFDAFEGSHLVLRANLREHIAEQLQQLLGALLTAQRTEEQAFCVCAGTQAVSDAAARPRRRPT